MDTIFLLYIIYIIYLSTYLLIYQNYFWCVEEENYGRNADLITKHFLAEGVVCDHSILIIDVERKPETTVSGVVLFLFIH